MDAEPGQPDAADTSFAETADISLDAPAIDGSANGSAASSGTANGSAASGGAVGEGASNGSASNGSSVGESTATDSTVKDSTVKESADKAAADTGGVGNGSVDDGTAGDGDASDGGAGEGSEDEATEGADGAGPRKRKRSFFRELFVVVVAALVLTILIKAFLVQVFSIPSGSMQNTLQPGDRILVNRLVYHLRGISRGDIVVFSGDGSWGPPPPPAPSNPMLRVWDDFTNLVGVSAPGTDYVKRVIGLPGDHVQCCDAQGRVTVNGVPLTEGSYLYPGDQPSQIKFNIFVQPGRLFVLGDHRSDSADSRYHAQDGFDGTIPEDEVVGRAFVIIWPGSRINDLPIPNTFQQASLTASTAIVNYGPAVGGGSAAAGVLAWRRRRSRRPRRDAA
jgi:signal peptidase I